MALDRVYGHQFLAITCNFCNAHFPESITKIQKIELLKNKKLYINLIINILYIWHGLRIPLYITYLQKGGTKKDSSTTSYYQGLFSVFNYKKLPFAMVWITITNGFFVLVKNSTMVVAALIQRKTFKV